MSSLAETAVARPELNVSSLRRLEWRRRAAWGSAALLLCGLVWLVAARTLHRSEYASATKVTTPAPVVAPPVAAPPALSPTVTVRVVSRPAGADVFLDGERDSRGRTPLALTLPRSSTDNLRVVVRMKGYEPQTSDLTPDSDSRLQMTLTRSAPPRPVAVARPRPTPKPVKPPPARPKQPVPDLHRGDVVDPFAR
ncbi:MAG: PEGA domain-containing protein, partial [Polyangia bacterium]